MYISVERQAYFLNWGATGVAVISLVMGFIGCQNDEAAANTKKVGAQVDAAASNAAQAVNTAAVKIG
jgi:hypothetical protein